jgi:hypothetical protein
MKSLNLLKSAVIGTALTSLAFVAQPFQSASAVTLTHVSSEDTSVLPDGWESLNWVVEGKVGSISTWEFALENSSYQVQNNFNWTWQNGALVNWSLDWDGSTVTFNIGNNTLSYNSLTSPLSFDGFYLWTRATQHNTVAEGTSVYLAVNQVNGTTLGSLATSSAVAPSGGLTDIAKEWYSSDTAINSLGGVMSISWDPAARNPQTAGANSRIGFKIVGFNLPQPVPEPGVTLGLLLLGGLGVASRMNKNAQNRD